MSDDIVVERLAAEAFRIETRGHILFTDEPESGVYGPTPTELLVASLAACVAHHAARALGRDATHAPLRVRCRWSMSEEPPWRVRSVDLTVEPPAGLSAERLAAVEQAVGHCTVQNTLLAPPDVTIRLRTAGGVAA